MEARRNTRKIAVQAVFQFFFSKEDINEILKEFCDYRIKEYRNYKKRYDIDFLKKTIKGKNSPINMETENIEIYEYEIQTGKIEISTNKNFTHSFSKLHLF